MGKSLRSKRMRANRIRKRIVNRPKEIKKLKEALTFEYNEQTENAHLSIFNDIVNGPPPNDGTYFEPSVTVLEKTQVKYENFLSRKIPKIAAIASKNLTRPLVDPKKTEGEDGEGNEEVVQKKKPPKPFEDLVLEGNECKPNKTGSWPKWMSQREIRSTARNRRKNIQRNVNRERRMNKLKKGDQKRSKVRNTKNQDVEMKDS